MKRKQRESVITIGDRCPDLRNNQPTPHSQGDRDLEERKKLWSTFCDLYEIAVMRGNRKGFIPLGRIPGPAVIIRDGKVVASTTDDIPLGPPSPELVQVINAWRNIWEELGFEPTPWEEMAATNLLNREKGEIPATLVMGGNLDWEGKTVPVAVALKGLPEQKKMVVVAVYNPQKIEFPSEGEELTLETLQSKKENPLSKLTRVTGKVETEVLKHTSLRPSSHQQTQPHFSQEQAQSHRPTKPNQRYRRRKR
jgi:hypothetical protein